MGLEDFNSDSSSSSSTKTDDTNGNTQIDFREKLPDYSVASPDDIKSIDIPRRDIVKDKYSKSYFEACWRCNSRKVRINTLNKLGDVWFCTNEDCRSSIVYKCNNTAKTTDVAKKIDEQLAQKIISERDFSPHKMALEDFTNGDSDEKQSKRQSQMFTRKEFEEFLDSLEYDFDLAEHAIGEYVYEYCDPIEGHPEVSVRVFSSVDKQTDVTREKDSDAIRTVIWDSNSRTVIGGKTKTLRIKSWRKNLRAKIVDLIEDTESRVTRCPNKDEAYKCSGWLVKREGEHGKFLGCTRYPTCEYTEEV